MEREQIVLIDTSSWIEALRKDGRQDVRDRVEQFLIDGTAAWCDMVAVELWNGARGQYEKKHLAQMEKDIPCLPATKEVWALAREMARKCRQAGLTNPSADLLITACALFHRATIEHCDSHIDSILRAGTD
jgi:predicted nucleic acid-binding protein